MLAQRPAPLPREELLGEISSSGQLTLCVRTATDGSQRRTACCAAALIQPAGLPAVPSTSPPPSIWRSWPLGRQHQRQADADDRARFCQSAHTRHAPPACDSRGGLSVQQRPSAEADQAAGPHGTAAHVFDELIALLPRTSRLQGCALMSAGPGSLTASRTWRSFGVACRQQRLLASYGIADFDERAPVSCRARKASLRAWSL